MGRFLLCILAIVQFVSGVSAAEDGREPSKKKLKPEKDLVSQFFDLFRGNKDDSGDLERQLEVSMDVNPLPVSLSETRQLEVVLKLSNKSKKLVQLEFPTTQRIEILIRDAGGRMVTQWSEDHAFATIGGLVSVNPSERIQYTANISTRDLEAGKEYILEGFLPHYPELRADVKIVPAP
jgi:hypothetical protein